MMKSPYSRRRRHHRTLLSLRSTPPAAVTAATTIGRNKVFLSCRYVVFVTFTVTTFLLLWINLFLHVTEEQNHHLRQLSPHTSTSSGGRKSTTVAAAEENSSSLSTVTTTPTTTTTTKNNNRHPQWFWIGMVRDAKEVQDSTWETLVYAACTHNVHIHVVVAQNADHARQKLSPPVVPTTAVVAACAHMYVETEQNDLPYDITTNSTTPIYYLPSNKKNRVQRIAMIRDAQRIRLRQLWKAAKVDQQQQHQQSSSSLRNHPLEEEDIVIVTDLDLFRLPSITTVLEQAKLMATHRVDWDVVCAAGITLASQRNELWYYDTYATVFWPDTFAHPLKRRLIKQYYPGEDPNLVRSDDQHGSFTQGDIMKYLVQQAAEKSGAVQVRSCFGGLSIYRASVWFDESCQYTLDNVTEYQHRHLERYASASDEMPCEHVTFHTCLQDSNIPGRLPMTKIAINPNMISLWKKNR
jgi:hypothetical protein